MYCASVQTKARDICDAYSEISSVLKAVEQVRECVDEKSKRWFQDAQDMGDPFNAPPPPSLVYLAVVVINRTGTIFQMIHQKNISTIVSQFHSLIS